MSKCRFIVLSYGRPDLQITLKNLPPQVRKEVELWVVPDQYKEYRRNWKDTVKSIECWPPHIDCVPKKRQWLAQNMDDRYFVIDDDIGLYVWSPKDQRYHNALDKPKTFAHQFLDVMPSLYDKYACVSMANKFMSDSFAKRTPSLIKENTLGFVVTGFRPRVIDRLKSKDKIWFNRTFMFTDIALPLQVLQATKSSIQYYGLVYNHSVVKALANTGTATYRDDFVKLDSALKMAQLFPGIVVGAEENGNHGGGMTIKKFFGRATTGVSAANLKASADFVAEFCDRHGLTEPPKIFEYDDQTPRAEIIAQFKRNWNKKLKSGQPKVK